MLMVVPVYEALNPASRRLQISKGFIRIVRSIFQCAKCGFRIRIVGARHMAKTVALLANEVIPDIPLRQWVISFPLPF